MLRLVHQDCGHCIFHGTLECETGQSFPLSENDLCWSGVNNPETIISMCWVILTGGIEIGAGETGPEAKRNLYKSSRKFLRGLGFQMDVLGSIPNCLRPE